MIYFLLGFGLALVVLFNFFLNKKESNIPFYIFAFLTTAMLAFRSQYVGGDTILYVQEFINGEYIDREWGWVLFNYLASLFGKSPFVIIFWSSIISILPFILLVNKYSNNKCLSLLFLFLFANTAIVNLETNLRQNVGTGLFLLSIYVYSELKNKSWKYLIVPIALALWGILCHSSLYFVIPLSLCFSFVKLNKKYVLITIYVFYILGSLSSEYASNLMGYFFVFAGDYDALSKLAGYETGDNLGTFSDAGFSIGSILVMTWISITIIACSKEEINNFFIKMLVLYAIVYCVFRSSDLMYRLVFTLQLCSFIYVPKGIKLDNRLTIIASLLVLIWIRSLFQLCTQPERQNADANMFPYTTIIEK